MRSSTVALVLTAAALASSVGVLAQNRPPGRFMPVDEVRVGMTGYGLTVFQGTTPERFDVTVVGVLHNFRPRMDLVLVRTTHPILERARTVAGMSGSPIYLRDGNVDRLIGAYAYGWEFGLEPIAGVTPIESMLPELHRARRTPPGLIPGNQQPLPILPNPGMPVPTDPTVPRRSEWDSLGDRMRVARAPVDTQYGRMEPLAVPFAVAGLPDRAMRYLAEQFAPFGIEPLQSGGTGPRPGTPPPAGTPTHFENGGSVSIPLLSGDISGAATGTVTYVEGQTLLAFGHPMMGFGEVAMPAAISRVAWIMASDRRSHKMAEPILPLGALQQDRPTAIALDERASAPTVPVHVRLIGPEGAASPATSDWNVTVAYHRSLFSRLVSAVVGGALETAAGDYGDTAWVVRSNVNTHEHGTLSFSDYGASSEGTGGLTLPSLGAMEAVDRLTENPFEQVLVDGVDVQIQLHYARDFYYIRSCSFARAEVDPGERVDLYVSLGQYDGAPVVRTIPLTIPREVAGRDVDVEVSAGNDTLPELAEPETIEHLIHNLTSSLPEDSVVVSLRMPGQGVMVRGRALPNLPGSAFDALRGAATSDTGEPFLNVQRTVVPVGRIVLGRDRVRIHVREVRQ